MVAALCCIMCWSEVEMINNSDFYFEKKKGNIVL